MFTKKFYVTYYLIFLFPAVLMATQYAGPESDTVALHDGQVTAYLMLLYSQSNRALVRKYAADTLQGMGVMFGSRGDDSADEQKTVVQAEKPIIIDAVLPAFPAFSQGEPLLRLSSPDVQEEDHRYAVVVLKEIKSDDGALTDEEEEYQRSEEEPLNITLPMADEEEEKTKKSTLPTIYEDYTLDEIAESKTCSSPPSPPPSYVLQGDAMLPAENPLIMPNVQQDGYTQTMVALSYAILEAMKSVMSAPGN